jgi:hypothetical protein
MSLRLGPITLAGQARLRGGMEPSPGDYDRFRRSAHFMMLYFSGVCAACFLVLTMTGVLHDRPDAEHAALICLGTAALTGALACAAERAARAQDRRNARTAHRAGETI